MALNCAILEDRPNSSTLLESHIHKMPTLHMTKVCQDFDGLESTLKEVPIGLLFLVVEELDSTHFDFLQSLPQRPSIIIYSNNGDLAIEAFKLQAVDFLEHPIEYQALSSAVQKAVAEKAINLNDKNRLEMMMRKKYFFVKSDYKIVKVTIDDILFVEGLGEYIRIYTTDQKVITLLSLSKIQDILPEHQFLRIHRSYIVNIDKIKFIQNNIVSVGEHQIPISKSQKKNFLQFIDKSGLL